MKLDSDDEVVYVGRRSPQGERGLKRGNRAKNPRGLVAPRKGSVG